MSLPGKDIIFELYGAGNNLALHFCLDTKNCRFHLTTHQKPNPLVAPNFCMLLRKHLVGSKLLKINTFDLERVCEFVFEARNELQDKTIRKVFVEIMGSHSNLILTNENNNIIDAIKHVGLESHEILPARKYSLPSNSKKSFLDVDSFNAFLEIISPIDSNVTIDKQISDHFTGISRSFINYLLNSLSIPNINLTINQLECIYNELKKFATSNNLLFKKVSNDYFPVFSSTLGNFDNNFFLDDFYFEKETMETFLIKKNSLLMMLKEQLKKYSKRLENINNKLKDCNNMDNYRLYGELITSNLYRFSNENLEEVSVQNYYDNNNEITIKLDKRFSVSKNVGLFFKKYNKLKNTLEIVSVQKRETQLELEYLESILFSIENSKTYSDLEEIEKEMIDSKIFKIQQKSFPSKKQDASEPLKFEFQGFTILVGKNNKQNDMLTLKIANRNDLWFHTQKIQGSHIILKTESKPVPDEVITYCARIAKENSKAKNSVNVPVDYCTVKHIKKPAGSKPGMVIYREFKTIIVR